MNIKLKHAARNEVQSIEIQWRGLERAMKDLRAAREDRMLQINVISWNVEEACVSLSYDCGPPFMLRAFNLTLLGCVMRQGVGVHQANEHGAQQEKWNTEMGCGNQHSHYANRFVHKVCLLKRLQKPFRKCNERQLMPSQGGSNLVQCGSDKILKKMQFMEDHHCMVIQIESIKVTLVTFKHVQLEEGTQ